MTTPLLEASPLWPAALDHIRYDSPDPARLADFYAKAMGMSAVHFHCVVVDGVFEADGGARTFVKPRASGWKRSPKSRPRCATVCCVR